MSSIPATTDTLTVSQAARLISDYLARVGLREYCPDIHTLLAENRRSRRSNIVKYGEIPRKHNPITGKPYYEFETLWVWIHETLLPLLEDAKAIKDLKKRLARRRHGRAAA